MKLHLLTGNAIEKLRLEADRCPQLYSSPDRIWIDECLGQDAEAVESQIDYEVCTLIQDDLNPEVNDAENAVRIHQALKTLSPLQASNERVWASLCHREYWVYATGRWGERNIPQRYFFQGSIRRSIERNAIARLWWLAHLTYNTEEDSYECTRQMLDELGQDFASSLIGRNISNNKITNHAIIKTLMLPENCSFRQDRESLRTLLKRIHIISGVLLIDALNIDEISLIITNAIDEIKQH